MCVVEFALQREMQSRWVRRGDYKSAPGSACRFRFHHSTSRNEHLYRPRLAPNSGANLGHRSAVVGVKAIYQQPQLEALSFAMAIRNHAGPIFITFLVVLMVVSIALFLYRNVRVKRRVQPVISVLVGVLVGSFSWVFGMPLIFAIPFSLVIILVNPSAFPSLRCVWANSGYEVAFFFYRVLLGMRSTLPVLTNSRSKREMQSRWVRRGDHKSAPGSPCRFRFHHSTSRNEHLYRPRLAPKGGANLGHPALRSRLPHSSQRRA